MGSVDYKKGFVGGGGGLIIDRGVKNVLKKGFWQDRSGEKAEAGCCWVCS